MTTKKEKKPRVSSSSKELAIPTKLTLEDIIAQDAQYDELIRVTFDNGHYTDIFKKFRPQKVDEMLADFANFLVDYEKTGRIIRDKDVLNYISLHIILYFSSLLEKFPEDIYEKLDVFQKMLNSKLVEKMFLSFVESEISNVYKIMYDKIDGYQKLVENDESLRKELKKKIKESNLENREIIERVLLGDEANA